MLSNTQISDAMVERGENAAHRWSALAPDAPFNFTDDEAKSLATFIISAALAGHVVVPLAIFNELKRRDDTISKIGPRGEQLAESVRANECSFAWSLVSAMISAAPPAQREG